jgi:hypothetical protein
MAPSPVILTTAPASAAMIFLSNWKCDRTRSYATISPSRS